MGDGILDFGGYPEIHCAECGEVQTLPDGRVRWVMVDWYWHESGWHRRIVGTIVMPASAVPATHLVYWKQRCGTGHDQVRELELHH